MKKIFYILFIFSVFPYFVNAQKLKFNKDKTFKILQITDTHWDNKSPKCEDTKNTIVNVVKKSNPDFIIITGDIITQEPVKEGWLALTKIIVEQNIPWSITFGNHDEEFSMTKKEIWDIIKKMPNFIGDEGSVSGVGNCVIPIYSSDGYYTKKNNNKPIPSMAFFHIPLIEYKDMINKKDVVGEKYEGIASSELNPGLFTAMIENKDIVGVFTGHDHDNNYIGIFKDIALGFGQVTGADAYGKMERGGRVIELFQGKRDFISWIITPTQKKHVFHYPSGLSEITNSTKIFKATNFKPDKNGVRYRYYEGKVRNTKSISSLKLKKEGVLSTFSIDESKDKDYFAYEFDAWIKIPETNLYKFYTNSDDGSVLFIDGQKIVDNDGSHSDRHVESVVALEAGFHKIKVLYFETYMGQKLIVGISSVLIPETEIPGNMLFIDDK